MTSPRPTSFDEDDLRLLVHRFYARVREDGELGPVFDAVIGTDPAAWEPHLRTMTDFWHTVILHRPAYKGNPLVKHGGVPGLAPEHFVRWLALFEEVAREVYDEPAATVIVARARTMGRHLTANLFGSSPPELL